MEEKTVEKMDGLFLSLATQIMVFDGNNFESIVSDFNELSDEWLKFKENKLTIVK